MPLPQRPAARGRRPRHRRAGRRRRGTALLVAPPAAGTVVEVATPLGPARAHVTDPDPDVARTGGTLVLGHGAGGGVGAPDLLAAVAAARAAGWMAVLVEQPWRVAGRRVAPAPPRLDEAWLAVLAELPAHARVEGPLVVGGRSAGAGSRAGRRSRPARPRCSAWPSRCTRPGGRSAAGRPSWRRPASRWSSSRARVTRSAARRTCRARAARCDRRRRHRAITRSGGRRRRPPRPSLSSPHSPERRRDADHDLATPGRNGARGEGVGHRRPGRAEPDRDESRVRR